LIDWDLIREKIRVVDYNIYLGEDEEKQINFLKRRSKTALIKSDLIGKIISSVKVTKSEYAYLLLLLYLGYVESGYSYIINITVLNKKDIWNEEKKKKIKSYIDVSKISLSEKLKFLKKYGFECFGEICDKNLRNVIAHELYAIEDDGTVEDLKLGTKYRLKKLRERSKLVTDFINFFAEETKPKGFTDKDYERARIFLRRPR